MTGAYDIQLNGRGTLNLDDASNGAVHTWLVYAIAPNAAFVMDISSPAVGVGQVIPQVPIPFSNSILIGTHVLGSGEPIVRTNRLYSGTVDFDGGTSKLGTGSVSGAEDISQASTLAANQVLGGIYSVSTLSNNGRGSIVLTSPRSMTFAIWAAGPSQAVGLQVDGTAAQPVVIHIEQ
jgi:hypothetical protein